MSDSDWYGTPPMDSELAKQERRARLEAHRKMLEDTARAFGFCLNPKCGRERCHIGPCVSKPEPGVAYTDGLGAMGCGSWPRDEHGNKLPLGEENTTMRGYWNEGEAQRTRAELESVRSAARQMDDANPKDLIGVRKTPTLSLIPTTALILMGEAMRNGAAKYGPFNWRQKNVRASIYVDAAMRHLMAWWDSEQEAGDSGCHHLGHAMACLSILVDAEELDALVDDRPGAAAGDTHMVGPSPLMLKRYEQGGES